MTAITVGKSLFDRTVYGVKITAIQVGTLGSGAIFKGTRWITVACLLWQNYSEGSIGQTLFAFI